MKTELTFKEAQQLVPIPRFWHKVRVDKSGCWLWTAGRYTASSKWDYGAFSWKNKMHRSHAFVMAQIFSKDRASRDKLCLHTCDVPLCVNPNHLYYGSDADNARDRSMRGRDGGIRRSGINSHNAVGSQRLSDRVLGDYSAGGVSQKELAKRYGLSKGTVWNILRQRHWTQNRSSRSTKTA